MKLKVIDNTGKETGSEVSLPKEIFGTDPNNHTVYLEVKRYMAAQRQGTHKTKQRSEVKGSTRKIKRQKGTGTARAGDIKNPLFRGGGRVFGPQPRDYNFKLNKKVKRLAKISALSQKAIDKDIMVVKDFTFDEAKTKQYVEVMNNLGVQDHKTLLVVAEKTPNVYLSARNVQKCRVNQAANLNIMDIMNAQKLILTENAIKVISETLNKN